MDEHYPVGASTPLGAQQLAQEARIKSALAAQAPTNQATNEWANAKAEPSEGNPLRLRAAELQRAAHMFEQLADALPANLARVAPDAYALLRYLTELSRKV